MGRCENCLCCCACRSCMDRCSASASFRSRSRWSASCFAIEAATVAGVLRIKSSGSSFRTRGRLRKRTMQRIVIPKYISALTPLPINPACHVRQRTVLSKESVRHRKGIGREFAKVWYNCQAIANPNKTVRTPLKTHSWTEGRPFSYILDWKIQSRVCKDPMAPFFKEWARKNVLGSVPGHGSAGQTKVKSKKSEAQGAKKASAGAAGT